MKYSKNNEISFTNELWKAGFTLINPQSKIEIAEYLGITVRSVERYIKSDCAPKNKINLLRLKRKNVLLNDNWDSFKINKNTLVTPNGHEYTPNDLLILKDLLRNFKSLNS